VLLFSSTSTRAEVEENNSNIVSLTSGKRDVKSFVESKADGCIIYYTLTTLDSVMRNKKLSLLVVANKNKTSSLSYACICTYL